MPSRCVFSKLLSWMKPELIVRGELMIRVAIIGTGSISRAHLQAYALFPQRCEVVALANRHVERANRLKEEFLLDCTVTEDYHELLHNKDIDLISICTPPHTHAKIAADCLLAGKHVLVEKPMAMSLEECDRMLEAADKAGRILSVIGQSRFDDSIMKLKHILDSGLAGRILHAQVEAHWWRGSSYYDMWWRGTWEQEGGGCTLNHGVHHIDLLQWMMGMPQSIQAVISNAAHNNSEVEDLSIAIFSYEQGGLAQVTSSVVHHGEERQIVLQGEHASISTPWKVVASASRPDGFPERNEALQQKIEQFGSGYEPLKYSGHAGQINDILLAIEHDSLKVLIDGREGRKVIELITAIYEAATMRRSVNLPLSTDSLFYTREGLLANAPRFHKKEISALSREEE